MPQFFLPLGAVSEGKNFELKGPEAFHLVKVLRCKPGQTVTLFDGKGGRFEGVIKMINEDGSVSGTIAAVLPKAAGRAVELTLYQGLLKASHWDWALEKGTELGVAAFVPVLTPRTVVLLHEAERAHAKKERWERVIMAAAKQCQIASLPQLREPVEFRDAIRACQGKGLTLLAWEGLSGVGGAQDLDQALRRASAAGTGPICVNLFVGPEGGFSDDEVELARGLGAVAFGLGPRVMRAETAAIAACAIIQHELGGL